MNLSKTWAEWPVVASQITCENAAVDPEGFGIPHHNQSTLVVAMKTTRLLAAFAGVSLATSMFAMLSPAPANADATAPMPTVVVNPTRLPLSFRGGTFDVDFKLDANGKPYDIRVRSVRDAQVARQIKTAFSQWTFTPAPDQKWTQEKRFVVPLEIKL